MKTNWKLALGLGVVLLTGGFVYETYFAPVPCSVPKMHLDKANVDICLVPGISYVVVRFDKPVSNYERFASAVAGIRGVDTDNSTGNKENTGFRILYYWSRTNEGQFISDLSVALNDPVIYDAN